MKMSSPKADLKKLGARLLPLLPLLSDLADKAKDKIASILEPEAIEIELPAESSEEMSLRDYWDFTNDMGVEIGTRSAFLNGEINEDSASALITQLRLLAHESGPIVLFIDSEGGELDAGLKIVDTIRCLIREPVIGVVVGQCCSMAVAILASCDYRIVSPNSHVLIHEGSFGLSSSSGKARDRLDYLDRQDEQYWSILGHALPDASLQKLRQMADKDRREVYLSAQEALQYGLVHQVLKPRKKKPIENGKYAWFTVKNGAKKKKVKQHVPNDSESDNQDESDC